MTDRSARVNRIRELVRATLMDGGDGRRLPSEDDICARYRASRNVVRDALGLLKEEGLIERRQGRGTFAMISRPSHDAGRLYFVGDDLEASESTFATLAVEQVPAPTDVAGDLGLLPGAPVVAVERLTSINGAPFSLQTSLLPLAHAGWLLDGPLNIEWYDELEAAGLHLRESDQTFEATVADGYVADQLGIDVGAPLLLFRRRLLLADGRPVELGFVRCRGDRLAVGVPSVRAPGDGRTTHLHSVATTGSVRGMTA